MQWNGAKFGILSVLSSCTCYHYSMRLLASTGVYTASPLGCALLSSFFFTSHAKTRAQGPPKMYAEWYDWYLRNPANASGPTWEHHLDTYGPNVSYEDFIANFTASKFDAGKWVSLFEAAGARYFVVVTVGLTLFFYIQVFM